MKIAYLAAGAAGMYCGSCLHDNTLAAALLKLGEDVTLVPIYTPIRTDERDMSEPRVFFGGINAYLQQKVPLFRYTPRWLDRWLDHPVLLLVLAGRGASVDAKKLGPMTVSMLKGEQGNQRKELVKLVDWLLEEVQPDVVHLSNSMMLGLARMIAERCGPPVVCSLSGEDIFLEQLTPPYYQQAREMLKERAAEVHAFTALNGYYADFMADYLAVPRERIHVIPHGLDLAGHATEPKSGSERGDHEPLRIGYLARICHDKGLHLLVGACELLAARSPDKLFELHAAGYLGAGDRRYFADLEKRIARGPLADRFTYHGELDRAGKIAYLLSLDIMSTPTVYRESKGLPMLESLANGTPVVVPAHGTFPELVEQTGGGLLHEPLDATDLASKLEKLLDDHAQRAALGAAGHAAVKERYQAQKMAEQTLGLYRELVS
ncbi:glycosyltransferase family 4 protein [Adhaeretor mobilis]|uniref:2-deoxystreptamine glucosyltransferase n=1 Tax=Adhaeretor mobilis TaxID=1930276 RepID=A0A517N1Z0_9BACT|nr:glycosyltransferase family 4 protein [Adhaeretor mobilis]QDT01154.1 2-deoxystreptamine glucosyltransferase [Adhaeretor mobilis]